MENSIFMSGKVALISKYYLNYYILHQILGLTRNELLTQNKYEYLLRGSAFCPTESNIFVSCQFWQESQIRHSHLPLPLDINLCASIHCLFICIGRTALENKLQVSYKDAGLFIF